jgi:Flp pilus assembly protein TadD
VHWCIEHRGMLPGVPIVGQGAWTKRDCFHYMGCDAQHYWNAPQIQATFSLWCGKEAMEFVAEWLRWCQDRRCLTDDSNECGLANLPGFRDHRHDQSILTNLCVDRGIEALPMLPVPPGAWSKGINVWSEFFRDQGAFRSDVPHDGDANGFSLRRSLTNTVEGIAHARQLHQSGQFAPAELICRAILVREPRRAEALHLLGLLWIRGDRPREGLELLRRCVRVAPEVKDFSRDLAIALCLLEHFEESPEMTERVLERRPNSSILHSTRGSALAGLGRYGEAVDAFERALSLPQMESPAPSYLKLGAAAEKVGDRARASIAYRQAVAIDPTCMQAPARPWS